MTHLKDQNWFAVALEFLIVVFGVFIGIQVDNWNQGRIELQKEREYLEQLARDLDNDLPLLNLLEDGVQHHADASQLITQAVDGASVQDISLEQAFSFLELTWDYSPTASTYTGLRNGAQLDIFRDADLRARIIDFYEIHQPVFKNEFVEVYNNAHDDLKKHFPKYVRLLGPTNREQSDRIVLFPIQDDLDITTLLVPMNEARDDIAFLNDLAEVEGRAREILEILDDLKQENRNLRQAILDYLD